MTACLYDKETTNYEDFKKMHSIVGKMVNKIFKSGVLRNCTFHVQRERALIQELLNSTCQQLQTQTEEEKDPLCTGHGYGLIKCSKGNYIYKRWLC